MTGALPAPGRDPVQACVGWRKSEALDGHSTLRPNGIFNQHIGAWRRAMEYLLISLFRRTGSQAMDAAA